MKLEKFDLEIALKNPERIRTREGESISEIYHFKTVDESEMYPVMAVLGGNKYNYNKNGSFCDSHDSHPYDLFLLPDYKEKFVNVYLNEDGELYVGNAAHDTLSNAKEVAKYTVKSTYIKTIKITSLPYEPQHDNK